MLPLDSAMTFITAAHVQRGEFWTTGFCLFYACRRLPRAWVSYVWGTTILLQVVTCLVPLRVQTVVEVEGLG